MKIKTLLNRCLIIFLVFLLNLSFSASALASTRTLIGEEKPIGNGTVRTWLKVDENDTPISIGVTLTEAGLEGLPEDQDPAPEPMLKLKLLDGSPYHTFEEELMFPEAAEQTAFNHMGFNWNAEGHGPLADVFYRPHFDVHFYLATPEYRHEIQNESLLDEQILNLEPPKEFLPGSYERAPNTAEPRMGTHYADMSSEQLLPGHFSNIFLYGVHNGNILFWEPMITRDYLKSKPNFQADIPLPEAYPVSGYYPTAYSVVYNRDRAEFDISLDNLTLRRASYPGNVYGTESCLDSRLATIIFKYEHIPTELSIPSGCQEIVELIDQEFES